MLIKINNNMPSRGEVRLAIADIVDKEYAIERANAEARDANARWVAQNLHDKRTTVIGKCIAVVPDVDYIRMELKYGEHVKEESFWRYYQKLHQAACPSSI
jgi:hypothetical protein